MGIQNKLKENNKVTENLILILQSTKNQQLDIKRNVSFFIKKNLKFKFKLNRYADLNNDK